MSQVFNTGSGMVLGKFLPPHRGHQYLVDFARHYVSKLTVLVCSLRRESIPGNLRHRWMCEMFPGCNVVHVTDENPQEPSEHPDFWRIWRDTVRRVLPDGPDYVFASENYGPKLAEILGAAYVPVDHARELVPVSASRIRKAPYRHWNYIPETVRPYYVKKVCVFGPESTGKSTLTRDLAAYFDTVYVHEYARPLLELNNNDCGYSDIPRIARGHAAAEDAMARLANRVLFLDTDLITTTIWSDVLFGKCPGWIKEEADRREYDLYLVTDVDVPWIEDPQRYLPERRKEFFERCVEELASRGRKYTIIRGSWTERFELARRAVETLFDES